MRNGLSLDNIANLSMEQINLILGGINEIEQQEIKNMMGATRTAYHANKDEYITALRSFDRK